MIAIAHNRSFQRDEECCEDCNILDILMDFIMKGKEQFDVLDALGKEKGLISVPDPCWVVEDLSNESIMGKNFFSEDSNILKMGICVFSSWELAHDFIAREELIGWHPQKYAWNELADFFENCLRFAIIDYQGKEDLEKCICVRIEKKSLN